MEGEKFTYNSDIVFREIGPNCVLVPTGASIDNVQSIFTLNETSAFVIKKIREGLTTSQIREAILSDYRIESEEDLDQTLTELYDELRRNNILL